MEWNYLVIVISGVLGFFLVFLELRRKVSKNIAFRVIASVFGVTALSLIAVPPSYKKDNKPGNARTVVLLTEGFHKDSIPAFPKPLIVATDKKLLERSGVRDGVHIPAIDYFLSQNPDVKSLHIIGTGLPDEELVLLNNTGVCFHQPQPAFGFQQVTWQSLIRSSDELVISGTFNNNSGNDVKIALQGLSTNLDSVTISTDSLGKFKLTGIPRQLGGAINYLIVTSGNDTLSVEKVPFEVEPVKPLKIFILSSAPSFEVNFLKRWLAENKFPVALRNKISTGKINTEFLNMDPIGLNFQSATLDRFDVVLADENSLNELSQPEISSLRNQVNKGLGLVIINNEDVKLRGSFGTSFPVLSIADMKNISLHIPDIQFQATLPGIGANHLTPQPYDQPLVWDSKIRILVNSSNLGFGRIIFSTLSSTYSLNLSGNTSAYGSLWAYLIEKAARKPESNGRIRLADHFPVVDNKTTVIVESTSAKIPELSEGESEIALKQNSNVPQQWTGAYWPVKAGWNALKTAEGNNTKLFVFEQADWLSVRHARNTQATRKFAEQSTKSLQNGSSDETAIREDVPPIYFYLLLLACCSYLWIERKFL